jgi:hypothetical protein
MSDINSDQREYGLPPPNPEKGRPPESRVDARPGGQSYQHRTTPEQDRQAKAASGNLRSLEELDRLVPHLGVGAYRPRLNWQAEAPTEKQRAYLTKLGIDPTGFSKGSASKTIDYFRGRREKGLASFKQLRALASFDVRGAEYLSFAEATALLSERFSSSQGGVWR